ncbi:major facilitator superfamily domain-containing protein [Naematelia encephala]|uniref:Major facilitator superfamily domain-containing protein n=1 Tax=Naematelia encephala TaxID=71784 RepID=A0A1Y2B4P3_9TREE|nr:major facilitator superfamily domain-containing protein [Naematelia encephala]
MSAAPADEVALKTIADEQHDGVQPVDANQNEPVEENESKALEETKNGFPDLRATKTNVTTVSTGRPYSIFTSKQKWFIVALAASAGIFSPISSNIYVPAIPTLVDAFGVSSEKINLTVTIYLVFQALTPAIWGSAADAYGRRPIYIICLLIYLLSCVGTALCPTSDYWLLMLMRILQATGGSSVIAIGTGVIADISIPQERGKYIGIFNLQATLGPALGPLLGGIFAFTLGWRSIFWFLAIACGVVLVPMICFQPETLRSLVGDGSIPPPLLNCTPAALLRRRRDNQASKDRGEEIQELQTVHRKFKPWASFVLLLEPEIILLFLWASLYYALWYAILTLFSTLLRDRYHVNEIIIGLAYIPNGVGSGVCSLFVGRFMDKLYRKEKQRVGGDHRAKPEEFRLERVRFSVLPFTVGLLLVSCIAVGWSMQANAPIAVPIVLNLFVGLGTGFLTTVTIYSIDLFPGQGGAVTATFNLVRCLFGAASVSVIQLMNTAMGAGWSFVVLSGVCILGTPMPLVVLKYGPKWRLNRIRKAKEKAERKRRELEQTQQV